MFSVDQLACLDAEYFNIVCADGLDVTIQSKNTGHYWYLRSTGRTGENACIIFHKHRGSHPYHQHGRARSMHQAVKSIQGHDRWQMGGRKAIMYPPS